MGIIYRKYTIMSTGVSSIIPRYEYLGSDKSSSPATPTMRLIAYNTSFANDAHWSQLHPGLSESAAIVAKAIDIFRNYNKNEDDTPKNPLTFDELNNLFMTDDKFKPVDINDEQIQNAMKQKLGYLRMGMADSATDYIKKDLASTGFVALIEQMIHVPANHQAYYGGKISKANLDVVPVDKYKYIGGTRPTSLNADDGENVTTCKNKSFGILRRISKLGNIDDIDGNGYEPSSNNGTHIIVYDNLVNITNPGGAAEGIAIIVNKDLVNSKLLVWNASKHPNKQKCNANGFPVKTTGTLHYFSDDFGQVVASDTKFIKSGVCQIAKAVDGLPDYGRPIILTAGVKGNELNIFLAIHSLNIFNLVWLSEEFINNHTGSNVEKDIEFIKKTKGIEVTDKTVFGEVVKYCVLLDKDINEQDSRFTRLYKIGNSYGKTDKTDTETKNLKDLYDAVYKQIGNFINFAFKNLETDEYNKLSGINRVNLFMGGDFNDPEGEILKRLLSTPIHLYISSKRFTVMFNTKINNQTKSCCANRDSQIDENRDIPSNKGKLGNSTGSLEVSYSRNFYTKNDENDMYPEKFHHPETFGYNGDYVLFGSGTNATASEDTIHYNMIVDNGEYTAVLKEPFNSETKLIASDHLPVYATVTAAGGGRRRRYSMRVLKRHTKKGIPKKLRASRRKRRAHTYKK